jgi:hypothetical protein
VVDNRNLYASGASLASRITYPKHNGPPKGGPLCRISEC